MQAVTRILRDQGLCLRVHSLKASHLSEACTFSTKAVQVVKINFRSVRRGRVCKELEILCTQPRDYPFCRKEHFALSARSDI